MTEQYVLDRRSKGIEWRWLGSEWKQKRTCRTSIQVTVVHDLLDTVTHQFLKLCLTLT